MSYRRRSSKQYLVRKRRWCLNAYSSLDRATRAVREAIIARDKRKAQKALDDFIDSVSTFNSLYMGFFSETRRKRIP